MYKAMSRLLLDKDAEDPWLKKANIHSSDIPLTLSNAALGNDYWALLPRLFTKILREYGGPNLKLNDCQIHLEWAVFHRDEEAVRGFLENGADLNRKGNGGCSPLSLAAQQGHASVAKLLLDRDINPNTPDKRVRAPPSWACRRWHKKAVRLLLENGADPNPADESGGTALSWAAEYGHQVGAALLLAEGLDIDSRDSITIVHRGAERKRRNGSTVDREWSQCQCTA